MTSEKQMDFMKKLAKWKGVSLDFAEVAGWPDDKASSKIDELKAMKSNRNGQASRLQMKQTLKVLNDEPNKNGPEVTCGFSPVQCGMVKKGVLDMFRSIGKWPSPEEFASRCLQMYLAFEEADSVIKEHFPEFDLR